MDKKRIADLLDRLCERPLDEGVTAAADDVQALQRAAAQPLAANGQDAAAAGPDEIDGGDRITAALASVLSDAGDESARLELAQAALGSAAARIEAQSALAFVDAVEQSRQAAPARLVEEVLDVGPAAPRASVQRKNAWAPLWSFVLAGSWSARKWKAAAACVAFVAMGGLAWSLFSPRSPVAPGADAVRAAAEAPAARPSPPAARLAPAPSKSTLAAAPPCPPTGGTVDPLAATATPRAAPAGSDQARSNPQCGGPPAEQFVDRPGEGIDAIAARARAEATRRAAAAAASKASAAQGRGVDPRPADHVRPTFGPTDAQAPAANTAPASPSRYGVAPPVAAPTFQPGAAAPAAQ